MQFPLSLQQVSSRPLRTLQPLRQLRQATRQPFLQPGQHLVQPGLGGALVDSGTGQPILADSLDSLGHVLRHTARRLPAQRFFDRR